MTELTEYNNFTSETVTFGIGLEGFQNRMIKKDIMLAEESLVHIEQSTIWNKENPQASQEAVLMTLYNESTGKIRNLKIPDTEIFGDWEILKETLENPLLELIYIREARLDVSQQLLQFVIFQRLTIPENTF